jgi:hypothetical protein
MAGATAYRTALLHAGLRVPNATVAGRQSAFGFHRKNASGFGAKREGSFSIVDHYRYRGQKWFSAKEIAGTSERLLLSRPTGWFISAPRSELPVGRRRFIGAISKRATARIVRSAETTLFLWFRLGRFWIRRFNRRPWKRTRRRHASSLPDFLTVRFL